MTDTGRSHFDAQVALATAQARAAEADPPQAEAPPAARWRRPAGAALRLVKPLLRPVLFRLRRYFTEPLRQDMLALHENARDQSRAEAQGQLDQLQRHIDGARDAIIAAQQPARDEMRIIYTALVDQIHAVEQQVHAVESQLTEATRLNQEECAALRRLLADLHGQLHAAGQDAAATRAQADLALSQGLGQLLAGHEAQAANLELASAQLARIENYAFASARRVALPCADGAMLVKTEAGYILCSDADLSLLSTLVDSGDLERGTRLLIERLVRPGDVFVDVGANIGMHTLAGGRAMAGQGTIIAFEPFEPTRRLLEKSVWINGLGPLTRIHGCAVSDRAGSHTLFLGASSGHHSLFEHGAEGVPALGQVEVRTVRLDDVVEPGLRVNLLKIDAEGAELAVLAGAAATLANSPDIALIVEFGPSHLRAVGQGAAAWLGAFEACGFEYRAIDPDTGALARRSLAELEAQESTNLFFARPGSAAWSNVKETA